MIGLYILIGVLLFSFIFLFLIFRIVFLRTNKPSSMFKIKYTKEQTENKNMIVKDLKEHLKSGYEEIYIDSFDGLKLYGKYYHLNDEKPVIICFHGYKGNINDGLFGFKKVCFDNDFNLLLVNQRSHGKSQGRFISFGINERRDVQFWANYMAKRFPSNKIILAGTSMGASCVLMASDLALPNNVCGIIADSPYVSAFNVIKAFAIKKKYPVDLSMKLVNAATLLIGKFDLNSHDSISSIKKSKLDILLIHGDKDNVVSIKNSEEIHNKFRNNTTLEVFNNCDHCLSFFEDNERYLKVIKDFIKKVTK